MARARGKVSIMVSILDRTMPSLGHEVRIVVVARARSGEGVLSVDRVRELASGS